MSIKGDSHELNELRQVAVDAVKAAEEIILRFFRVRDFEVKKKADGSVQTTADLYAERQLIDIIRDVFPQHGIDAEESGRVISECPYEWVIDPIDGTDNFVLGIPRFCTSLTLLVAGIPCLAVVNDPVTKDIFVAERNKGASLNGAPLAVSTKSELEDSRIMFIPNSVTKYQPSTINLRDRLYKRAHRLLDTWAPTLDWCLVAAGRTEAVVVLRDSPEKDCAGALILSEAKGRITDFEAHPTDCTNGRCVIGSNGTSLHDELLKVAYECYRP